VKPARPRRAKFFATFCSQKVVFPFFFSVAPAACAAAQQVKRPLFEKSDAKTSLNWAGGRETSTAQKSKVFLLLFVHKK
jgi:hypothetical protein